MSNRLNDAELRSLMDRVSRSASQLRAYAFACDHLDVCRDREDADALVCALRADLREAADLLQNICWERLLDEKWAARKAAGEIGVQ